MSILMFYFTEFFPEKLTCQCLLGWGTAAHPSYDMNIIQCLHTLSVANEQLCRIKQRHRRRHRTKQAPSTAAGRPVRWPASSASAATRGRTRTLTPTLQQLKWIIKLFYMKEKVDLSSIIARIQGVRKKVKSIKCPFFKNCMLTSNNEVKNINLKKRVCLFKCLHKYIGNF